MSPDWQAWNDRIKAGERWTPPPLVPQPEPDAATALYLVYWSPAAVALRAQAEQAAADPADPAEPAKPIKKRGARAGQIGCLERLMIADDMQRAVELLHRHGCSRDQNVGLWRTKDGGTLASDPVTSVRLLRRALVQNAVDDAQRSGRGFTR